MIRYRRLSYLALNVADLERSKAFYRDVFGLQQVGGPGADACFLRCSDRHHDVALYQGEPGLKRVGFELESEADIGRLRAALSAAGVPHGKIPAADVAAMHTGPGVRMVDPYSGAVLDFFLAGPAFAHEPFVPTVAKIDRLGHVVLTAAKYDEAVAFFRDVLNFRISDRIGEAVTFMRCFPNPLHHSLGIANGSRKNQNALHHVNFMVRDIDDIGQAMWRLKRLDVPIVYGPGRHPTSDSVFLYFLDPDGITLEYSFGMEEFPEEAPREARKLPMAPESYDSWGSAVDARKNQVGKIELWEGGQP